MSLDAITRLGYWLLDKGLVPDFVLRRVVRTLCRQRLRDLDSGDFEADSNAKMRWIQQVRDHTAIAEHTERANEQHYEVPTPFIMSCLGPYAKYSSCLYPTGRETLEEAEVLMLETYCHRAQLKDGLDILDLGCGWGSLTIYLAQKYPKSRVVGLSNSATQKVYIERTAKTRGLRNIEIITADVNSYDFDGTRHFDRVLSIEMFEHMKNYKLLMAKIATWLRPKSNIDNDESLAFVHLFCHRTMPYHFEENDGWMAQMFFTGGTMPSHDLLLYFQDDLTLIQSWFINGTHYARTLEHWLQLQDRNAQDGLAVLQKDAEARGLPPSEGSKTFYRFRVFYLACAEFFALDGGNQWGVGHYLFRRKD